VTLCDTGPLVALLDADDVHHTRCAAAAALLPPAAMITTWPCLTEAMYLLHRAGGIDAQNALWSLVSGGVLRLYLPSKDEWKRIQELMTQYADMPLDIADASLVSAAERLNDRKVFSIDNLLRAVRMRGGHFFDFVPIGP
jgi:predicted nucleic acid-binding protein